MTEVGDHVIIIGGYEDCDDTWQLNVVADQVLVDTISKSPTGDAVSYDDHANWLEKLPRFTLPAVVDDTYQIWVDGEL